MGAQGRAGERPHQALPSRLSAKTPGTAGKPPAGRSLAAAVSKTPHPVSAAKDAASKGQLTNKLEKSSSTPLVVVVTGDSPLRRKSPHVMHRCQPLVCIEACYGSHASRTVDHV